jgi:hypothetical protein
MNPRVGYKNMSRVYKNANPAVKNAMFNRPMATRVAAYVRRFRRHPQVYAIDAGEALTTKSLIAAGVVENLHAFTSCRTACWDLARAVQDLPAPVVVTHTHSDALYATFDGSNYVVVHDGTAQWKATRESIQLLLRQQIRNIGLGLNVCCLRDRRRFDYSQIEVHLRAIARAHGYRVVEYSSMEKYGQGKIKNMLPVWIELVRK